MSLKFTSELKNRLTFGIEVEFALATLVDGKEDPHPEDKRQVYGFTWAPGSQPSANDPTSEYQDDDDWDDFLVRSTEHAQQHIVDLLIANGVPAMTEYGTETRSDTESNADGESGREPLDYWQVGHDGSIEDPDDDYLWLGIEIKSPAYYFSVEAWQTAQKVCGLLANHFRIRCHSSCGFHVHVGNARDGFKTNDLKKIMSTIWVFEKHLETLHPRHRAVGNPSCYNLRGFTRLGTQLRMNGQSKVRDGLNAIQAENSADGVVELLTGLHRLAYNLMNLKEDTETDPQLQQKRKTIEFRLHESTLDTERVGHWIRLCVGLVEFADSVEDNALERFLQENVNASIEDFSVESLLKALRLPVQARYYGERIARKASGK